jgi:hypothetical protein
VAGTLYLKTTFCESGLGRKPGQVLLEDVNTEQKAAEYIKAVSDSLQS